MKFYRLMHWLILSLILTLSIHAKADSDNRIAFIEKANALIEKAKSRDPLRYEVFPNSLVLSQIILESGWGKSRRAIKHNNLLGLKSGSRFATFNSYVSSIQYYFDNLLTHDAYDEFRTKLQNDAPVKKLVVALSDPYSGNEKAYAKQLKTIIRQYELERYDD